MLARMFASEEQSMMPSCQDSTGAFLIDRSPKYFEPILNYLRTGNLIIDPNVNPEGVLEEAKYYGIDSLISKLELMAKEHSMPRCETYINRKSILTNICRDKRPLSRRDVVDVLLGTSTSSIRDKGEQELRFQVIHFSDGLKKYRTKSSGDQSRGSRSV